MKKIELLSPAGDMEKFYAALKGGADAFYLSGKDFGARKFAGNFSNDELIDVVEKSHLYDKKVYVTVNTIVFNDEINEVFEYIKYLNNINVDGVIVQDLGLIEFCKVNFKDLEIHASTQMSIHSSFGSKLVKELGVKRVVLARENTLEEIKNVVDEGIDVEVFVHGAHCISYSGQCLMSSLIGGRSGNRGACAQPCRQKYELYNNNHELVNINVGEYLLSPKDMKTLDDIHKLSEIGVESLKIEGRMKNKYYAFATAHEYHNSLMNEPIKFSSESIFNREYTKGRIFKTADSEFMNYNSPENHGIAIGTVDEFMNNFLTVNTEKALGVGDEIKIFRSDKSIGGRIEKIISKNKYKVTTKSIFKKGEILHLTYDTKLIKEIDEELNKNLQSIPLNISFYSNEDGLTKMELMSKGQKISVVKEDISQISNNIILTKDDVFKQLSKLGDTVYYLNNFECYIEGNIFIRKSDLNKLRREGIEKIDEIRNSRFENTQVDDLVIPSVDTENKTENKLFSVEVNSINQLLAIDVSKVSSIYYGDCYSVLEAYKLNDNIIPILPEISKDNEFVLLHNTLKQMTGLKRIMVRTLGQLNYFKEFYEVETDFTFNITNQHSIKFLENQGVEKITLSEELSEKQINDLKGPLELVVYGHQRMMITEYCIYRANNSCNECSLDGSCLNDRFNNRYPLMRGFGCRMKIMNNRPLNLLKFIGEISNLNMRLRFTNENEQTVKDVIQSFTKGTYRDFDKQAYTIGHFVNGVI